MEKINPDNDNLCKFGLIMAIAFLAVTLFILLKQKFNPLFTLSISVAFMLAAFLSPYILKPVYIFWMRLALVLNWINTRLILLLLFYLILTPIGMAIKLFGKDLLGLKIEKNKSSYWIKRQKEEFRAADYERQF
ncbi:MAG: SxtJ family membrane protein [Candidatus Omnitrophota bacterium]